ncbi:hypothetical protein [Calidifontibacter indicus]|uniref:hypothetical protein n=1 Tax=Calidifontibacter indicus TaxID=419650 RepID=UPI003D75CB26
MKGTNAPTVTVLDVGARLIRQRGTATGTPEFIAAYLADEFARDPLCGLTGEERTWLRIRLAMDDMARNFVGIRDKFAGIAEQIRAWPGGVVLRKVSPP